MPARAAQAGGPHGALDIGDRDDPQQPALSVDHGGTTGARERGAAEQLRDVVALIDQQTRVPVHQVTDRRGGPLGGRDPLDLIDGEQPGHTSAAVGHGKGGVAVAREVLLGLERRHVGGDADRRTGHELARRHAAEDRLHLLLNPLGTGRGDHEDADDREPQAANRTVQRQQHGEPDQHVAEPTAHGGGTVGGRDDVAAAPPEQRAGDAAAVERERRDQVEAQDERIDLELVEDQGPQRRGR